MREFGMETFFFFVVNYSFHFSLFTLFWCLIILYNINNIYDRNNINDRISQKQYDFSCLL